MVSDMAVVSDVSQAAGAPGQLSDGFAAPLCDASHLSVSARLGRLQFHRSGKFRILQFADIQDGPHVNKDTVSLIAAACDSARPDIVIFSGNQIAGYDSAYAGTFINRPWAANWKESSLSEQERQRSMEETSSLVRSSIAQFLQPLIDRGIPFAVTYGTHDFQCGLNTAALDAIYREFPGCLNPKAVVADLCDPEPVHAQGMAHQHVYACEPGTFALTVSDTEGNDTLGIMLVDSGTYALGGGYGSPSLDALEFMRGFAHQTPAKSIVFQNIPIPQYYELLRETAPTRAHAVRGYRAFDHAYYEIDPDKTLPDSYLGEGISCPDKDSGEFGIMASSRSYCAISAGHDHRNGFAGEYRGILMVANPTCGFGSYGPAPQKRAGRLFEFDIRHPYEPRIQLLEFGQIVGRPSSRKAYSFGPSYVPSYGRRAYDLLGRHTGWKKAVQFIRDIFLRGSKKNGGEKGSSK